MHCSNIVRQYWYNEKHNAAWNIARYGSMVIGHNNVVNLWDGREIEDRSYREKFRTQLVLSGNRFELRAASRILPRSRLETPHHRILNEPIISLMTLDQELFVVHLRPITTSIPRIRSNYSYTLLFRPLINDLPSFGRVLRISGSLVRFFFLL